MNRPIRKLSIALAVMLAAVFVNLNFVQVVKGDSYRNNPDNRRVLLNEYASPRGQIVAQGTAIASSKQTTDELKYLRVYEQGPVYAPVTGYYSFVYGTSGIEQVENSVLTGDDPRLFGTQLTGLLTGRNARAGSVELTLNPAAQQAAYAAMKANGKMRRGAVVALDPTTGAILAAVSTPSYDPNKLSSHSQATVTQAWQAYQHDPADPMLNRALDQLYPPGSVFKVIDSAAALKAGYKPDQRIPAPNSYWPLEPKKTSACPANHQGACVQNFNGETCDNGKTAALAFALAKSCNTAFAQLVVSKLGADRLAAEAKLFGFDSSSQLQVPLDVAPSTIGSLNELRNDDAALAQSSFGQRSVAMTPLQGAMISAAVANNGSLMKPYLVARELGPTLSTLSRTQATQLSQVIDPGLDQQLQSMMEGVITSPEGTGGPANITDIPGVVVGGKTGTADHGVPDKYGSQPPPHAWFSGFALQNGIPKIAVAVIIEDGGVNGNETTGGLAAGPVAKAVMEAYLKSGGGR
ncbi:MAG: peptidoglycan D,D-transpeptidase FtsI family protein [Jatrophihabitantaceae bacterium]